MSARASRRDPRLWKKWIAEHGSRLERLGLPLALYQDEAHWLDFLENGHLDHHEDGPPFDAFSLPAGQQAQLCAFLEAHWDRAPLLGPLRVRLGKEPEFPADE